MTELARLTGYAPERAPLPPDAIVMDAGVERFALLQPQQYALRERVLSALREFHARTPDEPGPDIGRLRRIAAPDLPYALWRRLIDELVAERRVLRRGAWLHLPDHTARLSEADRALVQALLPLLAEGRFDPPWVRDLAESVQAPEERVREVLRKMVVQGAAYQVVRDLFYDSERIRELADIVAGLAREDGAVSASRYRDAIGLGRKRAIQILEFFDRIGYTRRAHDVHLLRQDSGWLRH